MDILAIYLPTKFAAILDWLSGSPEAVPAKPRPSRNEEGFLSDLVFFADEGELDKYLNSFRGED